MNEGENEGGKHLEANEGGWGSDIQKTTNEEKAPKTNKDLGKGLPSGNHISLLTLPHTHTHNHIGVINTHISSIT